MLSSRLLDTRGSFRRNRPPGTRHQDAVQDRLRGSLIVNEVEERIASSGERPSEDDERVSGPAGDVGDPGPVDRHLGQA